MALDLFERIMDSGPAGLSADERRTLRDWAQAEVERLASVLAPAAWWLAEDVSLTEFCCAVLERGPQYVTAAVGEPESLADLVAPRSRFAEALRAQPVEDDSSHEDHLDLDNVHWPDPLDEAGWRAAHPSLAAAWDARQAILGDRVGREVVAAFCGQVRSGLLAGAEVVLDGDPELGQFQLKKRREMRYKDFESGEVTVIPPAWTATLRLGKWAKASASDGAPVPGDGPDARLLQAAHDLLTEHDRVALPGLGWLRVAVWAARTGTNPAGETVAIPERRFVVFRIHPAFQRSLDEAALASAAPSREPQPERSEAAPEPAADKPPWWKFW